MNVTDSPIVGCVNKILINLHESGADQVRLVKEDNGLGIEFSCVGELIEVKDEYLDIGSVISELKASDPNTPGSDIIWTFIINRLKVIANVAGLGRDCKKVPEIHLRWGKGKIVSYRLFSFPRPPDDCLIIKRLDSNESQD